MTVAVDADDCCHLARRCLAATASAIAGSEVYLVPVAEHSRSARPTTRPYKRVPVVADDVLLAAHSDGLSDRRISILVGMTQATVSMRLRRLGKAPNGRQFGHGVVVRGRAQVTP